MVKIGLFCDKCFGMIVIEREEIKNTGFCFMCPVCGKLVINAETETVKELE